MRSVAGDAAVVDVGAAVAGEGIEVGVVHVHGLEGGTHLASCGVVGVAGGALLGSSGGFGAGDEVADAVVGVAGLDLSGGAGRAEAEGGFVGGGDVDGGGEFAHHPAERVVAVAENGPVLVGVAGLVALRVVAEAFAVAFAVDGLDDAAGCIVEVLLGAVEAGLGAKAGG